MTRKDQQDTSAPRGATWQVFVGFDDQQAQQRASEVCDFLTDHFGPDFQFELQMCDFNSMGEPGRRQTAVDQAATAQILVFATCAKSAPSGHVLEWMEGVCDKRHLREGALVGLVCRNGPEELRDEIETQLRQLAHRAGLDYLTHAPDCRTLNIPNETGWMNSHAVQLGSVLESILNSSTRSTAMMTNRP